MIEKAPHFAAKERTKQTYALVIAVMLDVDRISNKARTYEDSFEDNTA